MDYIEGLPSKEGGYIRTGARTPMQWNESKNYGFSDSDNPYLPLDNRKNAPTISSQINDPLSVLSCVKRMIALHKKECCLWADGQLNVLHADYPFVYERFTNDKRLFIAVNPSQYEYKLNCPKLLSVYLSQNVEITDEQIQMGGISFVVAEEKE